jgi:hypothetical protein
MVETRIDLLLGSHSVSDAGSSVTSCGSAAGEVPAACEFYGPLSATGGQHGVEPGARGARQLQPLVRLLPRLGRGAARLRVRGMAMTAGAGSSSGTSGRFYPHVSHPMFVIVHVHSPRLTAHLAILDIGLAWPAARIQGNGHASPAVRTGDLCLGVPGVVLLSTPMIVGIVWSVAGAKISHREFSSSSRHADRLQQPNGPRVSCGRNARGSEFYRPLSATGGSQRAEPGMVRARQLHALVRRLP